MPGTAEGINTSPQFTIDKKWIYLPDADLYLDAGKKKKFGFVSHAHSDHSARHEKILCTPATADFLNIRFKKVNCQVLDYGKAININNSQITLYPAGHILGSAQILVEAAGRRLLYTGDFRTRSSRTTEDFEMVECDTLIMETTFGLPHYLFPPRAEIEDQLIRILEDKLRKGITPVVFAYPLGKAQEVLSVISKHSLPVAVEYQILRLAKVYQKYGIDLGEYDKFRRSEYRGKILLLPFNFRSQRFMRDLPDKYTIFMSGWGMDQSARFRLGMDIVLPYSDHADYAELLDFVQNTKAREIYCTHGQDDFVTILRQKGYNARLLIPPAQTSLFD